VFLFYDAKDKRMRPVISLVVALGEGREEAIGCDCRNEYERHECPKIEALPQGAKSFIANYHNGPWFKSALVQLDGDRAREEYEDYVKKSSVIDCEHIRRIRRSTSK
jgi:hypothetical protein